MRNFFCLLAVLVSISAGAAEEPRPIVDRAVRAHGGDTALRRAAQATRTGAGTLSVGGTEVAFTDEVNFDLPYRLRLSVTLDKQPKQVWVFNGDKAWQSSEGVTLELPQPRIDEMREEAYAQWLTTILPLQRNDLTLTAIADAMVEDRPAAGIKVTSRGHGDVQLFFDKETGLLVKLSRRTREGGQAVTKESFYSAHKEFGGAKLPTRIRELLNGKKFSDLSDAKYQLLRSRDDSLFNKP